MSEIAAIDVPEDRSLLRAGGREITYLDINPEAPRTLIHLHGGGTSRFEGLLMLPHARAQGWRVIVPDRPGYGRTSPLDAPGLMAPAGDIAALADHLGIERFALSGWSAGGPAAAAAAIACRGRVNRIGVINSAGDPHNPAWQALSRPMRLLLAFGLNRLVVSAVQPLQRPDRIAKWIKRQWRDEPEAVRPTTWLALDRMFAEGARQGSGAFALDRTRCYGPPGWGFTYADPGCPINFLHGERDVLLPYMRAVAAVTPQSALVAIPGGHIDGGRAAGWNALFHALAEAAR